MTTLRRRMMEDMQVRSLSPQTQATYVQQVSLFARHFSRSPELLGPEEIRSCVGAVLNSQIQARPRQPRRRPWPNPLASGQSSVSRSLGISLSATSTAANLGLN